MYPMFQTSWLFFFYRYFRRIVNFSNLDESARDSVTRFDEERCLMALLLIDQVDSFGRVIAGMRGPVQCYGHYRWKRARETFLYFYVRCAAFPRAIYCLLFVDCKANSTQLFICSNSCVAPPDEMKYFYEEFYFRNSWRMMLISFCFISFYF